MCEPNSSEGRDQKMENHSYMHIPHGQIGIIALKSCRELGEKIDEKLVNIRNSQENIDSNLVLDNSKESYLIDVKESRFSNGEGKVVISETVRGKDIFIISDIGNYSCTYKMFGIEHHMSPDEHFQDIKRTISAIGGKAGRITVIMPMLYASRQHKKKGRESLDCALALQELEKLGVIFFPAVYL